MIEEVQALEAQLSDLRRQLDEKRNSSTTTQACISTYTCYMYASYHSYFDTTRIFCLTVHNSDPFVCYIQNHVNENMGMKQILLNQIAEARAQIAQLSSDVTSTAMDVS